MQWVRGIQAKADRDAAGLGLVVESFIPGREYALEGLLQDGRLRVLALFDKPDPLDGPYFEETLYVTPSRLPQAMQDEIAQTVQRACDVGRAHERSRSCRNARERTKACGCWKSRRVRSAGCAAGCCGTRWA